ncbi:MAG TPA: YaeQ family protein [Pseudomonadales bacterium]
MALKSTVYRVELDVSDIDRGYYASHTLTLARHPSETEQRLMVRLLAFVLHADPRLAFGRGLSADEDPDLWIRDDTGAVRLWIDVGLPDERRVRRAAGRSAALAVLAYGERATRVWWEKNATAFTRLPQLAVRSLTDRELAELGELAKRNMRLHAVCQEGQITLGDDERQAVIEPRCLK